MQKPDCLYCDIANGRAPAPGGTIHEDAHWHVAHIGEPKIQMAGMLVIRSKRHAEVIPDLSEQEAVALGRMQRLICTAVNRVFKPERLYCICIGEGHPHLHFGVIPRVASMRASGGVQVLTDMAAKKYAASEAEAAEAASAVRTALQALLTEWKSA